MKRLIIGVLAHVDSGKTTLSEAMLYRSGAIRTLGRVDHGDAYLDIHAIERSRGITIFTNQAALRRGDTELTLLDTPGHVDFSAEAERTLAVLDYAVLVISGADGVQSHTLTLWRLLRRLRVPAFIFINKMDLVGTDRAALMDALRARLSPGCIDFGAEGEALTESIALCDDTLTERYLADGGLALEDIATAIARRHVFPCYFGAALRQTGVDELLDGLDAYTRVPSRHASFAAKVFKIGDDGTGGRLTYMAVTGGRLCVRDTLTGETDGQTWSEKVSQIRVYSGARYKTVETAEPGMVCAVPGLARTRAGDGLGAEPPCVPPALEPLLSYRVELPDGVDSHTALERLRRIEEEEPLLRVVWNARLGEIHVQLMGQVQLEVLKSLVLKRFGINLDFGRGGIVYRETIEKTAEGVGHYEPLRHYAEVHLLLEPGERGSGLQFSSACRTDDLALNWQRLVMTHLAEKTHIGVLTGSPLTDMKVTLIAGRAHIKHTEGGDFRQATYRALRQGLRTVGTVLLEPWYDFTLEAPGDCIGRAMSDISRMSGSFRPPETEGDMTLLRGSAPVSELSDYQAEVTGYTRGLGRLSCAYKGYFPCHNAAEVIESIGYDCGADLENTADSVFCASGAGFVVPWNEVHGHMHIPARNQRSSEAAPAVPARTVSAAYIGSLAGDKELLRIFERTYGPVRRELYNAIAPAGGVDGRPEPQQEAREYLLVDGYNIVFAWDDLSALARESLDAAREKLIDMLANYRGVRSCELILVFDAYRVKDNPGSVERRHGINVVYTREAETADMYIERATHELASRRRVRVATSDGMEQLIVLGRGAERLSASAFRAEVDAADEAIRDYIDMLNKTRHISPAPRQAPSSP